MTQSRRYEDASTISTSGLGLVNSLPDADYRGARRVMHRVTLAGDTPR